MNQISKEAMEFLKEAREVFEKNKDLITYRDDAEEFIALRTGFRDDCIMVYELGNAVGNFTGQLPTRHVVSVEYDELEKLKKAEDELCKLKYSLQLYSNAGVKTTR